MSDRRHKVGVRYGCPHLVCVGIEVLAENRGGGFMSQYPELHVKLTVIGPTRDEPLVKKDLQMVSLYNATGLWGARGSLADGAYASDH